MSEDFDRATGREGVAPAPAAGTSTVEVPPPRGPRPRRVVWLGYAIPISIVLIASLAIFVGYRAERHAGFAGESDQGAITATLHNEQVFSDALLQAGEAQTDYQQWSVLNQAGLENADPWCEYTPSVLDDPAQAQIVLSCELARTLQAADLPGYGSSGAFDVTRYADDVQSADSYFFLETDAATYLDAADQERTAERRMLTVGVTLSLALGLCTVAEQAYRRQWRARHRYLSLWLAVPGWIATILCLALVFTWEA